jgi:hypothetical protein
MRPGPRENEYVTFRRYSYQKSCSAGVDMVKSAGRKIPGHVHVVGKVYQTENPLPFHPRRECEDSRR